MKVLWEIHDKWTLVINPLETDVIFNSGKNVFAWEEKRIAGCWWKKFASGEYAKPFLWVMLMSIIS